MNRIDTNSLSFALAMFMIALAVWQLIDPSGVLHRFGLTASSPPTTLLTHAFVHGGLLHIGFNMMAFLQIGPGVERAMGKRVFLIFSLVMAVAVGWLTMRYYSLIGRPALLVGFSGVLFAYLGVFLRAAIDRSPNKWAAARAIIERNLFLVAFIIFPLIVPTFISGEAHLIGLVLGFLAAPFFLRR